MSTVARKSPRSIFEYGPIKKRRMTPLGYGRSSYSLAMRPELKYKDFVISGSGISTGTLQFLELNNVDQGADRDQRVGRRIRISKVTMVGGAASVGFSSCDIHLWSPRATSNPVIADFTAVRGCLANDNGNSWFHWTQYGGTLSRNCIVGRNNSEALNAIKFFPKGFQVFYSGPQGTSCDRNRLYFVIICRADTDSVGEYGFSVRIHYYDV